MLYKIKRENNIFLNLVMKILIILGVTYCTPAYTSQINDNTYSMEDCIGEGYFIKNNIIILATTSSPSKLEVHCSGMLGVKKILSDEEPIFISVKYKPIESDIPVAYIERLENYIRLINVNQPMNEKDMKNYLNSMMVETGIEIESVKIFTEYDKFIKYYH